MSAHTTVYTRDMRKVADWTGGAMEFGIRQDRATTIACIGALLNDGLMVTVFGDGATFVRRLAVEKLEGKSNHNKTEMQHE